VEAADDSGSGRDRRAGPSCQEDEYAMGYLEAEDRAGTFVPHAHEEHTVDLG
jgi:hypothetical protein